MARPTIEELTEQTQTLRAAPRQAGTLDLIVRRPAIDAREVLDVGELHVEHGLVGDNWVDRSTSHARASGAHLNAQLNVMSARMAGLLAETDSERAQAGDQLYLDLDLSVDNLPTGSRLTIGDQAVIEVTAKPHNGCAKFRSRFGDAALEFVNSALGQELRLRGFNARVVTSGTIRRGDTVTRLA